MRLTSLYCYSVHFLFIKQWYRCISLMRFYLVIHLTDNLNEYAFQMLWAELFTEFDLLRRVRKTEYIRPRSTTHVRSTRIVTREWEPSSGSSRMNKNISIQLERASEVRESARRRATAYKNIIFFALNDSWGKCTIVLYFYFFHCILCYCLKLLIIYFS